MSGASHALAPAFVIVRHGNTFEANETPRRIGARTDPPLVARGQEQARALGEHFAMLGWRFARVLVSPLRRTRDSAATILSAQQAMDFGASPVPQPADFLREIDHGPDENRDEKAVLARIGGSALAAWEKHAKPPPDWRVEAGSRLAQWRALFAAEAKASSCSPRTVLLVTSNGAARFALLADPALAQAAASLSSLKLPTGGYGTIGRATDGNLFLQDWGVRP